MCTAISLFSGHHLFGRTLDLERTYGEDITVMPRGFRGRCVGAAPHHAMIGVAHIAAGEPLYYDAVNEHGLAAAGLHFPYHAVYHAPRQGKHNIPSYALIPWLLSRAATLAEAVALLRDTVITGEAFSEGLPPTPLHWLVADKSGAVTVESVSDGLQIYENPFGVLANAPPFPYHLENVAGHMHLGAAPPQNNLAPALSLKPPSRGMGAVGLPGDFSSPSRFLRAVFAKHHTLVGKGEGEAVSAFFHIMDTVSVPLGTVQAETGEPVCTQYTSCADTEACTYFVSTYHARHPRVLSLFDTPYREGTSLYSRPLSRTEEVYHLQI